MIYSLCAGPYCTLLTLLRRNDLLYYGYVHFGVPAFRYSYLLKAGAMLSSSCDL